MHDMPYDLQEGNGEQPIEEQVTADNQKKMMKMIMDDDFETRIAPNMLIGEYQLRILAELSPNLKNRSERLINDAIEKERNMIEISLQEDIYCASFLNCLNGSTLKKQEQRATQCFFTFTLQCTLFFLLFTEYKKDFRQNIFVGDV